MEGWTRERLNQVVMDRLGGLKFIAVSNREPYIHVRKPNGGVQVITPASGLTAAIDPILRASGGTWVAHGSGDADAQTVDVNGRIAVPPEDPSYTLRRVWLPKHIEDGYYYGLSNEGLWPLCHVVFQRPRFRREYWQSYGEANERFAEAVLEEAAGQPAFVFIQDYHLGLLPRMLKDRNPNLAVAQFWHIPWPNRETFRAFPWKPELLDGMLGNDLLGFHLRYHCSNFLDTIDRNVEALVDIEHAKVKRGGHVTNVRPFPISIDFAEHVRIAASESMAQASARWVAELGQPPEILGIGIDRMDYTKGIGERLEAIDCLLSEYPEYIGRLTFLQIAVPTRPDIAGYRNLADEVVGQVDAINAKWARGGWQPIVLIRRLIGRKDLIALHLMADFCVVSSLHDGMNLVAKEYVASRIDGDGALILSAFTGSARELDGAILVNPFAPDEIAGAIRAALVMPVQERYRRMAKMRSVVAHNNIYRWAGKFLLALSGIEIADGEYGAEPANVLSTAETN